jgi:exopolysaccharide production protein ExoQ
LNSQPPGRLAIFPPILLGAVGPLAYFAPLGLAALLPMLAATLLLFQWRERRLVVAGWVASAPLLWPLALIALISTTWAIAPGSALLEAARLAGEIAIGLAAVVLIARLPEGDQDGAIIALAIGLNAAALLMLADWVASGVLSIALHGRDMNDLQVANAYSRGAVFHAVVLPPLAAALFGRGRPIAAALSIVLAVVAIFALHSVSAKLALALGIGVSLAAYRWPGAGRMLVLALCGAILAAPLFLLPLPDPGSLCWLAEHQPSALHRLYIWAFVDRHIVERPLLGWGMDASRWLAGPDDLVTLYRCETPQHPRQEIATAGLLPLHPHNAMLQIWVELGVPGALAAAAALFSIGWPLFGRGRDPLAAAAAAGTLGAASIAAGISFGIWQPWWVASFFLCAATSRLARSEKITR